MDYRRDAAARVQNLLQPRRDYFRAAAIGMKRGLTGKLVLFFITVRIEGPWFLLCTGQRKP
ncbi:hypothetical protein DXB18_09285 [Clostridium sp. OM02-18AC]|nr:hypothetical protein DWZ40_11450 [Clostridium sp. AF32-12BH]RHV65681.1 hypothetical protein DXB18_09285 [Clostridium sp. OM02-18AC]